MSSLPADSALTAPEQAAIEPASPSEHEPAGSALILPLQPDYPPCPHVWREPGRFVWWVGRTLFALVSLLLILAIVAAIPIVNFIALGFLLDVEGRVARTGRFLTAFPFLNQAPRVGVIAAGLWCFLLPLRILGSWAADAHLIDPGSRADIGLHVALNIAWFVITVHLLLALARGGSMTCFVRPWKNLAWLRQQLREGHYLRSAGHNVGLFVQQLRLRELFWLGARGFAVALMWLLIPTAFYAAMRRPDVGPVLLTVLGGLMLALTLMWTPFLQARFAATGQFRSGLQLREIRNLWMYAPIAWTVATIFLYLLALPLYLFKAALLPQDAIWVMTLVFIATIYPTRIVTGWAYGRAVRKRDEDRRANWKVRVGCSLLLWPLVGVYVFILYFTQFLGAEGRLVLFAHHALLLPAPFFLSL
ncbi:MAG: DUF4013 domain-containing protein [Planctomycetaceae bacterium]|nr:DUF4013 domain-containing protein [Planctomycetaceae bacterium]